MMKRRTPPAARLRTTAVAWRGPKPAGCPAVILAVRLAVILAAILGGLLGSRASAETKFPKPTGYVNDFAGVLDPGKKEQLEALLTRVDDRLGIEFAVAVVPDLGGNEVNDYAHDLFKAWGVGNKKTNKGLLLLDAVAEHKIWVEVGYGMEGVLPDGKVGAILDSDVVPYLKQGQREMAYASAVRAMMRPVLEDEGEDAGALDSLLTAGGYRTHRVARMPASRPQNIKLFFVILFIVLNLLRFRRRRTGWIGGIPFGGFGGGFGGGGGGGFGGFGGGMSGGGGAGRGY